MSYKKQKNDVRRPSKKVRLAREFRNQFIITASTMITSAFALVAAFAWNDLVKEIMAEYISPGQTMISRVIYVLLVTFLAVIISFQFGKVAAAYKIEQEEEEKKANEEKVLK